MSGERLRTGVVGCGLIAQIVHLPLLTELSDRFELVALSEPSRRVRERVGDRFAVADRHADWRGLLARERLDAVVVCSPNHTHAEVVLAALDLGVHVLVEKPLCLDPDDAERICARQGPHGPVVQVGYMKRYDAAWEELLERVPAGGLDGLRLIDVVTWDPQLAREPFVPAARLERGGDLPAAVAEAGRRSELQQVGAALGVERPQEVRAYVDAFLGALIHDVNLVHGLLDRLGAVEPVRATAARWQGAESAALAGVVEGGAPLHAAWLLLDGMEEFDESLGLYLRDEVARLHFPAPYHAQAPTRWERRVGAGKRVRVERGEVVHDSYRAQLERFHACVVDGAACRTPPQQAERDIRLLRDAFALGLSAQHEIPVG